MNKVVPMCQIGERERERERESLLWRYNADPDLQHQTTESAQKFTLIFQLTASFFINVSFLFNVLFFTNVHFSHKYFLRSFKDSKSSIFNAFLYDLYL